MILYWGERPVRRAAGWVAEFCPICRGPRPHRMTRIDSVGHLYHFIPLGRGRPVGHEIRCESCGLTSAADAATYAAIETRRPPIFDDLLASTRPDLTRNQAARLEREERARRGKLTRSERWEMLCEPFLLLEERLDRRHEEVSFDRQSGLGCLSAIIIPAAILAASDLRDPPGSPLALPAALVSAAVLGLFTLRSMATDFRRQVRGPVQARLVRALRPLRPGRDELDSILSERREAGSRIAEEIDAEALHSRLNEPSFDDPRPES